MCRQNDVESGHIDIAADEVPQAMARSAHVGATAEVRRDRAGALGGRHLCVLRVGIRRVLTMDRRSIPVNVRSCSCAPPAAAGRECFVNTIVVFPLVVLVNTVYGQRARFCTSMLDRLI